MLCSRCGKINDPQARFCSQCGQPFSSSSPFPGQSPAPLAKSVGVKVGLIVGIVVFLVLVGVAGIIGVVFYSIKNSDANRLAIMALKQNRTAQQVLGDIQKTGWPMGNISIKGGGSGNASFSMSVSGSKAKGTYYASLYRENGIWYLRSSRLQIKGGDSYELGGASQKDFPSSSFSP